MDAKRSAIEEAPDAAVQRRIKAELYAEQVKASLWLQKDCISMLLMCL
jgi:hypothetical protein